ncbi:transposase [Paraburkholderia piptadeniae]
MSRDSELCRRLQTIAGIGVLLSTAIVSAVGDASAFRRARDLAAWVGLVPQHAYHRRQATSAGHHQARERLSATPLRAG